MTFAADYIAAAPPEWRRNAWRAAAPSTILAGLYRRAVPDALALYGQQPRDTAWQLVVDETAAAGFGLAVGDELTLADGVYRVVELIPDDSGLLTAVLRPYA